MFLTLSPDKIWTFVSNPDKNEKFSSQCLSISPKRLQLPNVCLKVRIKILAVRPRPPTSVVEFFAETLSPNTPAKKINDYPKKNIQHQYWVIYHSI